MAGYQIDVNELLDLAIGTPECGAVNFRILHALLKVIINKVSLETSIVEFEDGCDGSTLEQLKETWPGAGSRSQQKQGPKLVVTQLCKSKPQEKQSDTSFIECEPDDGFQQKFIVSTLTASTRQQDKTTSKEPAGEDSYKQAVDEFKEVSSKNSEMVDSSKDTNDVDLTAINGRLGVVEVEISKITSLLNGLSREFNTFTNTVAPFVEGGEIDAIRGRLDDLERQCYKNRNDNDQPASSVEKEPGLTGMITATALYFYNFLIKN